MADSESGLDMMRSRIKRASRRPPPPRGATAEDAPVPAAPAVADAPTVESALEPGTQEPRSSAKPTRSSARRHAARPSISPSEPSVNLAIRVRQPLDERLVDLLHTLRRSGVRSSKVELIEMLLWELPDVPDDDLRARLASFRTAAPRGAGSSAEL